MQVNRETHVPGSLGNFASKLYPNEEGRERRGNLWWMAAFAEKVWGILYMMSAEKRGGVISTCGQTVIDIVDNHPFSPMSCTGIRFCELFSGRIWHLAEFADFIKKKSPNLFWRVPSCGTVKLIGLKVSMIVDRGRKGVNYAKMWKSYMEAPLEWMRSGCGALKLLRNLSTPSAAQRARKTQTPLSCAAAASWRGPRKGSNQGTVRP